jgi:hypothetical protein
MHLMHKCISAKGRCTGPMVVYFWDQGQVPCCTFSLYTEIPFLLYFAPSSFIYENRLCCGLLPHPLLQKRVFGKENKIESYSLLCHNAFYPAVLTNCDLLLQLMSLLKHDSMRRPGTQYPTRLKH